MYNYMEAIKSDIRQWIEDNADFLNLEEYRSDKDAFAEYLNDTLWVEDSVTGNASGSYSFSRADAKDYFLQDGTQYLPDLVREGFLTGESLAEYLAADNWEALDVTARCYLLGQAISEVLTEI